ncbi:MAG: zinc ribbon domain-containing protein [Oscillospiraceae bacterium]|nr:zinc ribbon domain-containing protein [Oscillospiraceae bacterium]
MKDFLRISGAKLSAKKKSYTILVFVELFFVIVFFVRFSQLPVYAEYSGVYWLYVFLVLESVIAVFFCISRVALIRKYEAYGCVCPACDTVNMQNARHCSYCNGDLSNAPTLIEYREGKPRVIKKDTPVTEYTAKEPEMENMATTKKFCPGCGKAVKDGSIFCDNCGRDLRA